jgi:hypothetical protein
MSTAAAAIQAAADAMSGGSGGGDGVEVVLDATQFDAAVTRFDASVTDSETAAAQLDSAASSIDQTFAEFAQTMGGWEPPASDVEVTLDSSAFDAAVGTLTNSLGQPLTVDASALDAAASEVSGAAGELRGAADGLAAALSDGVAVDVMVDASALDTAAAAMGAAAAQQGSAASGMQAAADTLAAAVGSGISVDVDASGVDAASAAIGAAALDLQGAADAFAGALDGVGPWERPEWLDEAPEWLDPCPEGQARVGTGCVAMSECGPNETVNPLNPFYCLCRFGPDPYAELCPGPDGPGTDPGGDDELIAAVGAVEGAIGAQGEAITGAVAGLGESLDGIGGQVGAVLDALDGDGTSAVAPGVNPRAPLDPSPPVELDPYVSEKPTPGEAFKAFYASVSAAPLLDVPSFSCAVGGGDCPTFTVDVMGVSYTFDWHCVALDAVLPVIQALLWIVAGLSAVRLFLEA